MDFDFEWQTFEMTDLCWISVWEIRTDFDWRTFRMTFLRWISMWEIQLDSDMTVYTRVVFSNALTIAFFLIDPTDRDGNWLFLDFRREFNSYLTDFSEFNIRTDWLYFYQCSVHLQVLFIHFEHGLDFWLTTLNWMRLYNSYYPHFVFILTWLWIWRMKTDWRYPFIGFDYRKCGNFQ